MKALVTGGAGFIGSHIAERLISDGHEVIILDDLSSGYKKNTPKGAKLVKINVLYKYAYKYFLKDVDVVFHNAASKKNICLRDPEYDLDVNGKGTLILLRACAEAGVKKFVHASTGSVYGEVNGMINENTLCVPVSYYGVSKLAGERYVSMYDMNTTILRYFHVYGERQEDDPDLGGVVAVFKKLIKERKPITIHGTGNQQRSFTHVSDVVEANIQAWLNPISKGQVYNVASAQYTTIAGMAKKLGATDIKYTKSLEGDIFRFDIDNSKIISELGIKFRSYEQRQSD